MKRFALLAALVCAASVFAAVATARSTATNLHCQAGAPGTCHVNPSSNSVTFDTRAGGYALAYLTSSTALGGTPLAHANFSFNFTCTNYTPADPTDCVGGGVPRLSIPIGTGATPNGDVFAFVDAAGCGYTPGVSTSGSVNTTNPACAVNVNTGASYPNWAAFAAANPTWTIRKGHSWFVIADFPYFGLVSNLRGWKS